MAAEYVTPDAINFMATPRPRPDLPDAHARALRRARPAPDGVAQPDALRDRLHGLDRGARGHRDRHLGRRPRAHDPGRGRSGLRAAGHHPARPRLPAARAPGRRARAHRARPRPPSTSRGSRAARPAGVICEIMNDDGTMARVPDLQALLRQARHQALLGRRPDRLPPPHRAADRAPGGGQAAHRATATSAPSATARRSTTSTTSRSSRATSTARPTCSCACTASA